MKVTVNVTREHYEQALALNVTHPKNYCEKCILAVAFQSLGYPVSIGLCTVRFLKNDIRIDLPEVAINTRQAFDNCTNREFIPCSFKIEIPDEI